MVAASCIGLALLSETRPTRRIHLVSVILGVTTVVIAGLLIVMRAAHETARVMAAASVLAAGLSAVTLRPVRRDQSVNRGATTSRATGAANARPP